MTMFSSTSTIIITSADLAQRVRRGGGVDDFNENLPPNALFTFDCLPNETLCHCVA